MQIEILSVSQPSYTKTANGGYNKVEVAYKQDGKVSGKNLVDFGTGAEVYKFFTTLQNPQGTQVEVESVKNGKYWNWTSARAVESSPEQATGNQEPTNSDSGDGPRSRPAGPQRGRVTGSNYETPEERAKRQVYIVRQSSITNAIATLAREGTKELDSARVIEIAKVYENYVLGGVTPAKAVAEGDGDIPF